MKVYPILVGVAALAMLVGHWLVFDYAPMEQTMGAVQKIFYYHVPSAWACYLGFICCAVGSFGYLYTRKSRWDAFALAAAEVGLVFGMVVLATGPLWARPVWGVWWRWEPRLTAMMLLFLMYAAYWVLHSFGGTGEGVRRFAAVLGVFGAPNIYFVHYAVKKWGGVHPEVDKLGGGLNADMRTAWLIIVGIVLLLFGLLVRLRYRAHVDAREVRNLRRRLSRLGGLA